MNIMTLHERITTLTIDIILLLSSTFVSVLSGGEVTQSLLRENQICGTDELLYNNCLEIASEIPMSRIRCLAICQQSSTRCQKPVYRADQRLCYFRLNCIVPFPLSLVCSTEDESFKQYEYIPIPIPTFVSLSSENDTGSIGDSPSSSSSSTLTSCQNDGVPSTSGSGCDCQPYSSGTWCEITPKSCEELRDWGFIDGDHFLKMNVHGNPISMTVRCRLTSNTTAVYVAHNTGSSPSPFNATYQQYIDGFYIKDNGYWLGLENIHRLTSLAATSGNSYNLVIEMAIAGVIIRKRYTDFQIGNADTGYLSDFTDKVFVINSLGLQYGRCLSRRQKFSTWDNDADGEADINLAAEAASGWWFSTSAYLCNLLGKKPTTIEYSPEDVSVLQFSLALSDYGKNFESFIMYLVHGYP